MRTRHLPCLLGLLSFAIPAPQVVADDATEGGAGSGVVDFARDVRPIFAARCFECHGADTRESSLRLDRGADALKGGDSGKVIVPGAPDDSLLFRYVSRVDPDEVMPPKGDPLSDQQVALIRKWIEQGAEWPETADVTAGAGDHWSFQPIQRLEPPQVNAAAPVENEIDAFVQARLESEGIEPSPEAERYTLIKRLYYDLLGLSPEPEAVDRFVNSPAADAYETLVDELLDSPHFGERWGRHWLDMARYADSDGYEKDNPRYNAWKYRDWVINAINADMPFDEFTIEQLAGDLLPEPTPDQLLATAFNRQTLTNTEGGTDQEEFRVAAVMDRVETLGTVWLGLTVGCARCHSHKYDPLLQREYYELFAFFNNGDEVDTTVATSEEGMAVYRDAKANWDARLAEMMRPLNAAKEALRPEFAGWVAAQRVRVDQLAANPAEFHQLETLEAVSEQGAKLERLEDGSLLATGERPLQDVYNVTATLNAANVTAFRLEVLSHEALPSTGPGRADHGNFVLSEIGFQAVDRNAVDAEAERLNFRSARADFAQSNFEPAKAIDGTEDSTGWAISPQMGKDHYALFYLTEESAAALAEMRSPVITARLSQQYNSSPHTIGRFRLSAMSGVDDESLGLPENVRKVLAVAPEERNEQQERELFDYFTALDPDVQALQANVDEFKKTEPFQPEMTVRVIQERTSEPRTTHLMKRGDFLQPLEEVQPGVFAVLPDLPAREDGPTPNRLDLAHWLVSPENPLTPRVAVNHVWQHLFGRGLVKTMNDFGVRGEPPTHPELLDWLASEYIRLGWSRKALIRTIVLSHTYRQSSQHREDLAEIDPENRLLYRQNRVRVEAETVRDLYLCAGGLLDARVGGPSVFPRLPPGIAELSYANNFKWGNSTWNDRPDVPGGVAPRDDVYRRGLYTFFKRTAAHPTLVTFDCPDANVTCVERNTSNTPLQALATLNNDVFVDAARGLARRGLAHADLGDDERIALIFRRCLVRPATDVERSSFAGYLSQARDYYGHHSEEATAFGADSAPDGVGSAEYAAWIAVSRMIMNLDEFITRE
jgi:mono/diheme cytochrome c family protein